MNTLPKKIARTKAISIAIFILFLWAAIYSSVVEKFFPINFIFITGAFWSLPIRIIFRKKRLAMRTFIICVVLGAVSVLCFFYSVISSVAHHT